MEEYSLEKEGMKEPKDYVSVSTRLPNVDMLNLKLYCKKNNIAPSEYIRNLIHNNLYSPKSNFLSGVNKITYNKVNNSFSWRVKLDSGQETEVLNNLSLEFLKNLQQDIGEAIKERNQWVHQTKDGSVDIPKELVGGEE